MARCRVAGSVMSPTTTSTGRPRAAICSANWRSRSSRRATTTTPAPCRANSSATARPMPLDAPVTIARLILKIAFHRLALLRCNIAATAVDCSVAVRSNGKRILAGCGRDSAAESGSGPPRGCRGNASRGLRRGRPDRPCSRPFSTPISTSTSRKLRLSASLTAAARFASPKPVRALIGTAFG